MVCGGKGSFQTVNLQLPARTIVCSHSAKDRPPRSIKSNTIMTIFRINVCAVVNSSTMVCSPKRIASTGPKCDDFSRLDWPSFDRATIVFFDQELKAAKADKNELVEMLQMR